MVVLIRIRFQQFPERFMILAERMESNTVLYTLKIQRRVFFQNFPQSLFCLFILPLRQLGSRQKSENFHIIRMAYHHIPAVFLHLFEISLIFTVECLAKSLADHSGNLLRILIHCLQKIIELRFYDQLFLCCRHMFSPLDYYFHPPMIPV